MNSKDVKKAALEAAFLFIKVNGFESLDAPSPWCVFQSC
jgi:hypothetical protein